MKVVSVESQTHASLWDPFVRSAHAATFYHQFGWRSVFARSYGHRCHYLAAMSDTGECQGILPLVHVKSRLFGNDLVSLPFVNYGGLLCNDEVAAKKLLEAADALRLSSAANHVELRHLSQVCGDLPTNQHKVTMILELASDADTQWNGFNPKLRNQVRKAEKSDLQTAEGHLDLLDGFYEVVARNMRDLGSPVHSKAFFRNVLETFPDSTRILAVYFKGEMIAAGLVCWFKDKMEIPWASSIRDYNSLCPNNLLYWSALKFAIARGSKQFDFGRSTPNEGTYNFKKQWGAQPLPLNWQYLGEQKEIAPEAISSSPKYQMAIAVWQRLPVQITKIIGPIVRKNISL